MIAWDRWPKVAGTVDGERFPIAYEMRVIVVTSASPSGGAQQIFHQVINQNIS